MEPVGAKDTAGDVTGITCPDCHGSIWMQTGDGGEVSLVCRIGHSYSPESFAEIQAANVENALWAGVRSLEEQASLAGVMASRALRRNDPEARERFEHRRTVAVRTQRSSAAWSSNGRTRKPSGRGVSITCRAGAGS